MNTIFRPDFLRTFFGFLLVFMVVFFSYSFLYAYIALEVSIQDFLEYAYILSFAWFAKVIQGVIICFVGAAFTIYCHKCSIDEKGVYGKNTVGIIEIAEWDNMQSITAMHIPFIPVLRIRLKCGKWSLWVTKKTLLNRKFSAKMDELNGLTI